MLLKTLTLQNIRNYEKLTVNFQPGFNILVGDNAAGKSNLLEAIYFLTLGRSERVLNEQEIIRWGQNEAIILGEAAGRNGTYQIGIAVTTDQDKKIQVNRKGVSSAGELRRLVPAVALSTQDGELISGEPSRRRSYLNHILLQTEPEYGYHLVKLKRILLSRNEILRQIRDERQNPGTLEVWNQSLQKEAEYGTAKRRAMVQRLEQIANKLNQDLSLERKSIALAYKTNCPEDPSAWPNVWLMIQNEEIKQAKTLIGPQRDEVEISLSAGPQKMNARLFGSQGEQILTAYILKLSQAEIIKEDQNQDPLILADDIFAEIDERTQAQAIRYFQKNEQVFFTTTDLSRIKSIPDPKTIYKVQDNTCEMIS